MKIITSTDYFNPSGVDKGLITSGSHTGFVDFNDTSLGWANNTYDLMNSLAWFPSEIDCSNEAKSFQELTDNEKMMYKLTLSNLSFLDSAQESHILDFRSHVSNRVLRSTLTLQAYQESNHSKSYATVLSEIGNAEEVFQMYKTEQVLMDRNNRVAELFARHINGGSDDKLLASATANILLEGVLFMTSFVYIFVLGDKMQGSSSMVQMIAKDEISAHAPLFANIFKNMRKQNQITTAGIDECIKMMYAAVKVETDYAKHMCDNYPVLGISFSELETTIQNFANARMRVLGLNIIFPNMPKTRLEKLVDQYSKVNNTRSNLFESSNKSYAKDSIDMDF